jgi:NitT/TauT family transport system substrate-binding protein
MCLVMLVGCSESAPQELDRVRVQLSWFNSVEFVGFYTARELGFYEEAGLAVSLLEGGPEVDALGAVEDDDIHFGIATGDALVRARSNEQKVVGLSAIYRKNPLIIMVLAGSDIQKPQDLVGKTVGVISEDLETSYDILFLGVLNNVDVDPTSLTFVTLEEYFGADDLLSGRMNAASGFFATNELVQARLRGQPVTPIFYSDYGVSTYVNVLFTNEELIAEDPELVQRFVRATFRGYEYAIEHPEEAVEHTLRYGEGLDPEIQSAIMEAQIPFIDTGERYLGWMNSRIWQQTQSLLFNQDLIAFPMDAEQFYTNDFLTE